VPPQRLQAVGGDDRFLVALSAIYLGIALGCAAGGLTLTLSHNVSAVCWVAACIELAALAWVASRRTARRSPSSARRNG
jgi:predicted MFS family arabinose efflux permease